MSQQPITKDDVISYLVDCMCYSRDEAEEMIGTNHLDLIPDNHREMFYAFIGREDLYDTDCRDCIMSRREGSFRCLRHYDPEEDNANSIALTGVGIAA